MARRRRWKNVLEERKEGERGMERVSESLSFHNSLINLSVIYGRAKTIANSLPT